MFRLVTYFPSRPAKGESFTRNVIETVGSSTAIGSRATGDSASATVSPIVTSSMPERTTISPAGASFTSTRLSPSNTITFPTRAFTNEPSCRQTATSWPGFTTPFTTRPIARRPR